jgi:hypothetical protein
MRRALACVIVVSGLLLGPVAGAHADTVAPTMAPVAGPSQGPGQGRQGPAQPVQNITWQATGRSTATVSWQAPANAQGEVHYSITIAYTADTADDYTVQDQTATSLAVKNIEPGTIVSATINDVSQPVESGNSASFTQPVATPGAPTEVNLVVSNPSDPDKEPSVKATWNRPESSGGSDVTGYMVRLYANPSGGKPALLDSVMVSSSTFQKSFGAQYETRYYAIVQATNKQGYGAEAKTSTVKTGKQAEPAPTATVTTTTPPSQTPEPSATETSSAPVVPSAEPTQQPQDTKQSDESNPILFWVGLPVLLVLLAGAIIALVYVVRYNRQVDADNARRGFGS